MIKAAKQTFGLTLALTAFTCPASAQEAAGSAAAAAPAPAADALAHRIAMAAYGTDTKDEYVSHPQVSASVLATAKQAAAEQYDAVVHPNFIASVATVYRRSFSVAELVELDRYYATPQAQRVLRSFTSPGGNAEIAEAKADPVALAFRNSAAGRKELTLGDTIASAMLSSVTASAEQVNRVVLPKIQQSIQAALVSTKRR